MTTQRNLATIQHRPTQAKPYVVVLRLDNGKRKAKSFPSKTAAARYQSRLNAAITAGEQFDERTAEPASWSDVQPSSPSVVDIAQRIVADKWSRSRAKTRRSFVENLAHVIAATSSLDRRLAYHVATHALVPSTQLSVREMDLWQSIQQTSPPADTVDYGQARAVVTLNLNGKPAAVPTQRRRVAALKQVIERATGNRPNDRLARTTKTSATHVVAPSRIGTNSEARLIIDAIQEQGIRRALLLMLYAGLRPSEAIALRWVHIGETDLYITDNTPSAGSRFTDSGQQADVQPPKWRPNQSVRVVPIIGRLAELLDEWRDDDPNGLVCARANGGQLATNDLSNAWRPVRKDLGAGWRPSRLKVPYDLRHTHASIALNGGLPYQDVAARLGHSPDELMRTYAACVEEDRDRWTSKLDTAFG